MRGRKRVMRGRERNVGREGDEVRGTSEKKKRKRGGKHELPREGRREGRGGQNEGLESEEEEKREEERGTTGGEEILR